MHADPVMSPDVNSCVDSSRGGDRREDSSCRAYNAQYTSQKRDDL